MKNNKMYNVINIAGGIVCVMLTALLFVFNNQKILIGVLFRGAFSLLILYNAIYVIFTNSPSFMVRKGKEKYRKIFGVILLLVGIFGFVTTLLGYGINGYPLLNWTTIF
jgi:uncharacterized membrane protein YfcA